MANNKKRSSAALVFALIMLLNPNIHTFDLLPDFIGYLIIAKALSYAVPRAPYFSEARGAFMKLALLSLVKYPAFVIVTTVRSGNVSDGDISALFALAFATVEIWLSLSAIGNLFSGLFHLGERTEARATISTFPLSKRGKRTMTPEGLRTLSIAFVFVKCLGYFLPELLLLSRAVLASSLEKVFNPAKLYPYALILSMAVVLTVGIIFSRRFSKYIKAIYAEGKFTEALDSIADGERLKPLTAILKVRDIRFILVLMSVAVCLSIDVRFDNLDAVNLLPRFFFALMLGYGAIKLSAHSLHSTRSLRISSIATAIAALAAWISDSVFLSSHGYDGIASKNEIQAKYLPVVLLYFIEAVLTVLLLIFVARALCAFVYSSTGLDKNSPRYSTADIDFHKSLKTRVYIWCVAGSLSALSKAAESLSRYFSYNKFSGIVDDASSVGSGVTGMITVGLLPWLTTAVFILSILFIGYSLYLFKTLGDEAEMKYI